MASFPSVYLTLFLSFVYSSHAVTVFPGDGVLPKSYVGSSAAASELALFKSSAPDELSAPGTRIIISSHPGLNESRAYHPGADSFVRGAVEAWAQHQHLVLRPDEVWFTILTQMNFYMNAHGDDPEVRSVFVSHQGKNNIHIEGKSWMQVLAGFKNEIQRRVKTDWLLDWILPKFSTSTANDEMTANVLMMGLMQSYFTFSASITCGLPSVTLLGEARDWERLAEKMERLPIFGKEPTEYQARLKPILSRFVETFKSPHSPSIRDFWTKMVVANPPISGRTRVCGAPPPEWGVGGWIVGFHYWTSEGKPYGRRVSNDQNDVHTLTLDNVRYPVNSLKGFPVGFAKAPIVLAGVGNCSVLAGNVGKKVSKGMPPGYMEAAREADITLPSVAEEDHSMLQPGSAWMLYGPFSSGQPKSSHTQQTDPIVQSALNRNLGQGQCPKPPALQPFSRRK